MNSLPVTTKTMSVEEIIKEFGINANLQVLVPETTPVETPVETPETRPVGANPMSPARKLRANNESGISGVDFIKSRGKWCVQLRIPHTGKWKSFGDHDTLEEATEVRLIIYNEYGI